MGSGLYNILDIIYQIESSGGKDPKRLKPNKYGALGSYQIRPDAYKDVVRTTGDKYKGKSFKEVALDDKLAREAAKDYLAVVSKHLVNNNMAPTMDALLAGYHSGMGNVVNGNIGPEGMKYLMKAKALRGL